MNKRAYAILLTAMTVLCVAFFLLWQFSQPDQTDVEALYESSLRQAKQCFEEYAVSGLESSYWDGVAQFRCFMKAYLILQDGSTPDYNTCNRLYGSMLLEPEAVQANVAALNHALGLLCEKKTEMSGFLRISELANLLTYG